MYPTPSTQGRHRRGGAEPHRIVSLVANAKKPLIAVSDFGRIVAINTVAAALLGLGGDALASNPDREGQPSGMVKREIERPRETRERLAQSLARFPDAQMTRVRVTTSQFSGWLVILDGEQVAAERSRGA